MARNGSGVLLNRATPVSINGLVTLSEAARRTGTTYDYLRMWLRYHDEVDLLKLGPVLLLKVDSLEKLPVAK